MAVNATTLSYCRHDFRRSNHAMVVIRHAIFPRDTASVLGIWREFIANSPVNLDYQNNDAEFANLPGKYAAPKGCVLLADREGEIEGCVAMRQVTHEIRSEEHTSELQSLMRNSYAVFCLKKKNYKKIKQE